MRKASVLSAFLCGLSLNASGSTTTTTTTTTATGSASAGAVAGVQSAPLAQAVAGVESLPSTSTDTGQTPLVVLGVVILATGIVLLRRPIAVPT